jgi:hypothetical protein
VVQISQTLTEWGFLTPNAIVGNIGHLPWWLSLMPFNVRLTRVLLHYHHHKYRFQQFYDKQDNSKVIQWIYALEHPKKFYDAFLGCMEYR